ncbi:MAG: hypothetical protein KDK07_24720 [Bauldia sp.]|nr:hypothetical protein [Bauldia sp.]
MAAIQINAAAEEILAEARATGAAPTAEAATLAVPGDFCTLWRTAKPVLETAATILAFFAPPVAGTLRGLIKVGDQIAAGMGCP